MRLAILTSSRADYGFFRPLLKRLDRSEKISVDVIAFGTHTSKQYGHTVDQIISDGVVPVRALESQQYGTDPIDISMAMGGTVSQFAKVWQEDKEKFDWVLCLGDRYELFSAVLASLPFGIKVAHLSGGEETTGAIDNFFRHGLTLMSHLHFTNTQENAVRVKQLLGKSEHVHHTGSLAIDNILQQPLFSIEEFSERFGIDLSKPTLSITFHPETVDYLNTDKHIEALCAALMDRPEQLLISLPNADTSGNIIRERWQSFKSQRSGVFLVESLGSQGYYTSLKHAKLVVGNSSSGIVEAASFGKYVLNLGQRQAGREQGENVLNVALNYEDIQAQINSAMSLGTYSGTNIYGDGNAAKRIVEIFESLS